MPLEFQTFSHKTKKTNLQSFSDCRSGWSKEPQWENDYGSFLPCFLLVKIGFNWHSLLFLRMSQDTIKEKCKCQLTFIFVFKNVTEHFGFEVKCQIKFVTHTQCVVALEDTNWPHFWPLQKATINHRANIYAFLPKLCLHTILHICIWKFMFLSFAKPSLRERQTQCPKLHPELHNFNPHNVPHSLISWNPRERMFVVKISLLIFTFLSLMSQILSLMQTIKEGNPHPRIAPCVNMWSVAFFFFFFFFFCWCCCLCHLLNVGACICHISSGKTKWSGPHHTITMLHFVLFHNVTCYTKFYNITHPCWHYKTP
jgi:hypothetical protein